MEDLIGTAGARARQLARLESTGTLEQDWLRRQLALALDAWAEDEKTLAVDAESREDY